MTATNKAIVAPSNVNTGRWNRGQWSEKEHTDFKRGVIMTSWGKWSEVSKIVITRSPDQVKSHAQKYKSTFPRETELLKNKTYPEDDYGKTKPSRKNARTDKGAKKRKQAKRQASPVKTKSKRSKNVGARKKDDEIKEVGLNVLVAALGVIAEQKAAVLANITKDVTPAAAAGGALTNALPAAEIDVQVNEAPTDVSVLTAGHLVEQYFMDKDGERRCNPFLGDGMSVSPSFNSTPVREDVSAPPVPIYTPVHVPPRLVRDVTVPPSPIHAPVRDNVHVSVPLYTPVRDVRDSPSLISVAHDSFESEAPIGHGHGVPRNLIHVSPFEYDEIKKLITDPVNYNDPKEYYEYQMPDGITRMGIDWGTALRNRITERIRDHLDGDWWKGNMDSVTSPGFGRPKSGLIIHNENKAEELIALLVAMYDFAEWRTPVYPNPHSFAEFDHIMTVIHKAHEMWNRIKSSLARGHYTLFGGHMGWKRVGHIDEVVQAFMVHGQTLSQQFVVGVNDMQYQQAAV